MKDAGKVKCPREKDPREPLAQGCSEAGHGYHPGREPPPGRPANPSGSCCLGKCENHCIKPQPPSPLYPARPARCPAHAGHSNACRMHHGKRALQTLMHPRHVHTVSSTSPGKAALQLQHPARTELRVLGPLLAGPLMPASALWEGPSPTPGCRPGTCRLGKRSQCLERPANQ